MYNVITIKKGRCGIDPDKERVSTRVDDRLSVEQTVKLRKYVADERHRILMALAMTRSVDPRNDEAVSEEMLKSQLFVLDGIKKILGEGEDGGEEKHAG